MFLVVILLSMVIVLSTSIFIRLKDLNLETELAVDSLLLFLYLYLIELLHGISLFCSAKCLPFQSNLLCLA